MNLGLPRMILAEALKDIQDEDITTLAQWGNLVDDTVDAWLRSQNSDILPPKLPKQFRGRCQTPKISKSPTFSPLRKAEQGAFEPADEVLTIATKRHVTQIRRMLSLKHRLIREEGIVSDSPKFQGLVDEWICILKAPVLERHFAEWISQQPELGYPPWPLPEPLWLDDVICLTKHQLNIAMAADRRVYGLKRKYAQHLDNKYLGSKQAFSSIRGSCRAPVTQVLEVVECDVVATWDISAQQLHLNDPLVDKFQVANPITFLESSGVIWAREEGRMSLQVHPWPTELPHSVKLRQSNIVMNPNEVASKLAEYWVPLWTVPPHQSTVDQELNELISHLPLQEPLHVDFDLPNLKRAIGKLKQNSALGVDGISSCELKLLPDGLLVKLLEVFQLFPEGFLCDFMMARTFPLNKVDGVPLNSQTRPITVLAQLYRVWGSMICHQILLQWGHRFPQQITGFLPRRGALMAAYGAQTELEIDLSQGRQSSGLTLDLMKCFNLIRHDSIHDILVALHVPRVIVNQWIRSISRLSRYWVIEGGVFGPYECNNGLPEGDIFSVVAMLGIGLCWVSHTQAISDTQIVTWAYADNWAWKVYQVELHRAVMLATQLVVRAFGLVIDFAKTWYWSNSSSVAMHAKALFDELLPDANLQQKSHAKDLGLEMRYSGSNRLGHTKSRCQEGQDRITRLAKIHEPLSVKERLLETAIWPAAYHGSEMYPVPHQILQTHRSCAADALFGSSHSMNASIALLLTSKRILDPSFFCIANAIRSARTWLLHQSPETQHEFLKCASRATGRPQDVKGPASALKAYLCRVDWSINATGVLLVGAFQQCHLLQDSFQKVFRLLTHSWQEDFFVLHTQRKELHSLRSPSRVDSVAVLKKFPDSSRKALIREISGAYQIAAQKAKWIPEATLTCRFCTSEDTRVHRVAECPAFHSVREPFQNMLDDLIEQEHHLLWFPMVLRHPDTDAHMCIHNQEPIAIICPEAVTAAQRMLGSGSTPTFFTDGSCAAPSHPTSRYAGFAVIMDIAEDNSERADAADRYLVNGQFPRSLQLVAAGKVVGEQTIGRAELIALITVAESVTRCRVFSDSAYAIGIMQSLQMGCLPQDLAHKDNLDLIHRAARCDLSNMVFEKIAAHVDIGKICCPLHRYKAIGNCFVDKCAVEACHDLNPGWAASLQAKHNDLQVDREAMLQICKLHLELHKARQDAENNVSSTENRVVSSNVGKTIQTLQREMTLWVPASAVAYDSTFIPGHLDQYFLFGDFWLEQFQQWLQSIQWDTGGVPPFGDVGITWFEVGVSLSRQAGAMLPIIRSDDDGVSWVFFPTSADFNRLDIMAADLANAAMQCWNAYLSLMMGTHPVSLVRGLQNSLFLMGHKSQASGFKPRPWISNMGDVFSVGVNLLSEKSSYQTKLELPWECRNLALKPKRWDLCKKNLKVGQALARGLRRASGDG